MRRTTTAASAEHDARVAAANNLYDALARAGRTLRSAGPMPVGPSSFSALATLSAEGPLRLSDLAAAEGVTRPTMTRIVAALEKRGYLRRRPDPQDGRAQLVSTTRAGRTFLTKGRALRVEALADRLDRLPAGAAADVDAAIALLRAIAAD
jgi:DNA-binding MarR family transcriptional regulator